jgi:hypothetical protein
LTVRNDVYFGKKCTNIIEIGWIKAIKAVFNAKKSIAFFRRIGTILMKTIPKNPRMAV